MSRTLVGQAGDDRLDDRITSGAGPGRAARPEISQFLQADVQFQADRLPGPLGQQAVGGQQPYHRLLQGVMLALRGGAGVFGAAGLGQRAGHRLGRRRAPRVQVPLRPPGPAEGTGQPHPAVLKPVPAGIRPGVHAAQLGGDLRQVRQGRAVRGSGEQLAVGVAADSAGQRPGPVHDLLRPRHRH